MVMVTVFRAKPSLGTRRVSIPPSAPTKRILAPSRSRNALLILRGYWIALHARDKFGSLLVVGIITQMAVQVFLNISVVTNLLTDDGEDEIVLRLGKKELFLAALAEAHAEETA